MNELDFEMYIDAIPNPTKDNNNPIHHKRREQGSVIDKYRSEILTLHNHYQCSYGSIRFWLNQKHGILISRTAIYNRVNYWKELGLDG